MVIEGHFAGTRAKHYTERDLDELQTLYVRAYPFIVIDTEGREVISELADWQRRITRLKTQFARDMALERRLTTLEDEVSQMREVHRTDP